MNAYGTKDPVRAASRSTRRFVKTYDSVRAFREDLKHLRAIDFEPEHYLFHGAWQSPDADAIHINGVARPVEKIGVKYLHLPLDGEGVFKCEPAPGGSVWDAGTFTVNYAPASEVEA